MDKKTVILDADSILYANACLCEESTILVTHTPTGRTKEFSSITDFRGRGKLKDTTEFTEGCFLHEINKEREVRFNINEFSIETVKQEVKTIFGGQNALRIAKEYTEASISAITNKEFCKDVIVVIGGENNFRKQLTKEYKANRSKIKAPIRLQDLRDYVKKIYNVIEADNCEADDVLGYTGWGVFNKAEKIEDCDVILAHIDKDILQVPGWHYDFRNKEMPYWIGEKKAAVHFYRQMLVGDTTDNIRGLSNIKPEIAEKYDIKRYQKGVGKVIARKLIHSDIEIKEMLDIVVELYCNQEIDTVDWKDELQLQYRLLRLQEEKGKLPCIFEHCKRIGINLNR